MAAAALLFNWGGYLLLTGRPLHGVQFQGGAMEAVGRAAVLDFLDDSCGPHAEACSVCFDGYGDSTDG